MRSWEPWRSLRRGNRDDRHVAWHLGIDLQSRATLRKVLQIIFVTLGRSRVLSKVPVHGKHTVFRQVVHHLALSKSGDFETGVKWKLARCGTEEDFASFPLTHIFVVGPDTRGAIGLADFARVAAHRHGERLSSHLATDLDDRRLRDDGLDGWFRFGDRRFLGRFGGRSRSGADRACAARDVGIGACAAGEGAEKEEEAKNSMVEHSCLRG